MIASLLIVFREVLEAGLIVGIILAATAGVPGRLRWIGGGVAGGIAGACLVAAFAGAISSALAGMGQEVFTASILLLAVAMLAWHVLWMSRHARQMTADLRAAGAAVREGRKTLLALAVVVGVAVLREGAEVVLFLTGLAQGGAAGAGALLAGGVAGLGLGAVVSFLLYRGLLAIPVHRFFAATNVLVALVAAGMAGQAAATLAGADLVPAFGGAVWDTGFLVADDSVPGRALHALVGYASRPSGIQLAAFGATLGMLALLAGRRTLERSR